MKEQQLIIFGEVLYDCFPDGNRILGGAPFNVAWHCQAFGLQPVFVSRIGEDGLGQQIKQAMQQWGLSTQALQLDPSHQTGKVQVTFEGGEPSYEIVENSAWDYIEQQQVPENSQQSLLYHGSLATRHAVSSAALEKLKENNTGERFVDINLRQPWYDDDSIERCLNAADDIKLNQHELTLIVPEYETIGDKIAFLMDKYALRNVIVTQGEHGAMVVSDSGQSDFVQPPTNITVVDTVGAGDAFSSVLILGKIKNWPMKIRLQRAQEFAAAIIAQQGATVSDKAFYQPFMQNWQLY